MKALTIHQPYASLIAVGAKRFETRSWATKYRGRVAIHAGMKELDAFAVSDEFCDAAADALNNPELIGLTYGAVIAVVEIVGCWPIKFQGVANSNAGGAIGIYTKRENGNFFEHTGEKELLFGDWTPGRYAWELADVKMLPEPIPVRGRKGLWNWEGADAI